ncbi:hypothetical protein GGI05_002611 [Coemansia sp. RSA 2603]|nr:hypothetical protein GGI05_002611 [Coemansia sp. RSA 2603]
MSLNNIHHTPQNIFRDNGPANDGSHSVESNKSYHSMITPSPEPMSPLSGFNSNTLLQHSPMSIAYLLNYDSDNSLMLNSSFSLNLNTPTKRLTKKRKADAQPVDSLHTTKTFRHNKENKPATSNSPDTSTAVSVRSRARPRHSSGMHERAVRKLSASFARVPMRTPEKLFQLLRPSGSPTRVSGSKVVADVNFTDADYRGLCRVDKSLVCKGFWESIEKVGRVCLPRRSGKTYNMTQMLLFFSMLPEAENLDRVFDSVIDDMSLEDGQYRIKADKFATTYKNMIQSIFESLSAFVSSQFGRYILLVDEYDIPFISIHLADWDIKTKKAAQGIMKLLLQTMFKDNIHLRKGLLTGVFEIPLTELGSGANNIKEIRMIPTEESDIQSSILSASSPHSGGGLDALTDSFWFNAKEVELMLDQSAKTHPSISTYKPCIMATIKDWYNGYYIGRFRGKYNPWSVSSFIETLCNTLSQTPAPHSAEQMRAITQSAARAFWVTTGTTGLIEAQIDKYRGQFVHLAKRLLSDYESFKNPEGRSSRSPAPVPLVATRLNLINYDGNRFSEPGLLTLCLYAGYLTRRESTSVCIPNHEVYQVWLQLFARAVMGSEMADSSANYMRGALLQELFCGSTELLSTLAISSHGVLSNHNTYKEKDYANHVANTLMAVSRFGMLTHPDQRAVSISHVVPIREGHTGIGRCDYAMRLFGSDNQPNRFGVIIEFKLIENHRRDDSRYHERLAAEGLRQISEKNYDSFLLGCLERMDVGMAIGNNVVYSTCQLYRRESVDSPWYPVDSLVDDQSNKSFV